LQVYPYLKEIKRVLKKGGIGLISFYNFKGHFELFKEMSLNSYKNRTFPSHMRVHFITEEMFNMMLEDVGMEIVEVDKTHFLVVAFRKIDG